MENKYEYVILDSGHEYDTPCELLLETSANYLIKHEHGEVLVSKGCSNQLVRKVKEKVSVHALVLELACEIELQGPLHIEQSLDNWCKLLTDKLIKAGALKEGLYEK
jgi:hypothetical protein